ncbi:MAG TPA: tetratricopeptide repeat protein [Thermoanaerobaculia bacterium]|nr:tetratricopeptide repeat protein [Thermoanaerobaculia bacterium]
MSERGKVVPMSARRRVPSPRHVAEFAEIARRLQRERDTAAHLVERLLRETPRERWSELAEREELRTCGALEKLGNRVAKTLERDPREALALSELAVAIVQVVPSTSYHPVVLSQLRAHAWKDVGQSLAYLGRYDEALSAFDRAEDAMAPFVGLTHDQAIVRFVRATTLQEIDRHDESFALLAECKEVFREHADNRRLLLCGIAEGVLLHRLRKYREAREAYLLLLAATRESIDREAVACLHNVIGHCSVDLGDYPAADTYLSRAIELFHELGQPLQAAKAELGRGRLLVRMGQVARGVAHLRAIRAEFLRHRLVEEAGLCGLEIVEAQLARNSVREAEELARQIVSEFRAAGLNDRAITALRHLSAAITARRASVATVGNVRDFILSLRTCPEREFVATA